MPRGYRLFVFALIGFVALAFASGWALQPQEPNIRGDSGFRAIDTAYQAGGADCQPSKIGALAIGLRQSKADACADAKEEHREAANELVEARRSADAANAQAVAAYDQARIAGWGFGAGIATLFAAVAAAVFAERAAHHTKRGADEAAASHRSFIESERGKLVFDKITLMLDNSSAKVLAKVRNIGKAVCSIYAIPYEVSERAEPCADEIDEPSSVPAINLEPGGELLLNLVTLAMPQPPATVSGFLRYSTIGLRDRKTYFHFGLRDGASGPESLFPRALRLETIDPMWQPEDT